MSYSTFEHVCVATMLIVPPAFVVWFLYKVASGIGRR